MEQIPFTFVEGPILREVLRWMMWQSLVPIICDDYFKFLLYTDLFQVEVINVLKHVEGRNRCLVYLLATRIHTNGTISHDIFVCDWPLAYDLFHKKYFYPRYHGRFNELQKSLLDLVQNANEVPVYFIIPSSSDECAIIHTSCKFSRIFNTPVYNAWDADSANFWADSYIRRLRLFDWKSGETLIQAQYPTLANAPWYDAVDISQFGNPKGDILVSRTKITYN